MLGFAGAARFAGLLKQALSVPMIEHVSSRVYRVRDQIRKNRLEQNAKRQSTTTA